jgi:RIO kinase 1
MPQRNYPSLARPNFDRGALRKVEIQTIMRLYGDPDVPGEVRFPPGDLQHNRLITDVVDVVGDGKEATVYRCRAVPELGAAYVAVKVYRADKFRAFANHATYRAGEHIRDRRMRRAVQKGTRRGKQLGHHDWVDREWSAMCAFFDAGVHSPSPLACSPDSIAMEFIGNAGGVAPRLTDVRLHGGTARRALDSILFDVEKMLRAGRVHGDLSAYNILYADGRPVVIDFPQAVDVCNNPNAQQLLHRDVDNVCHHFQRYDIQARPSQIAASLWRRFQRAEL